MVTEAPPDVQLAPVGGKARPLEEWVTNFHLVGVVLDPYTNESAWILSTARRVLRTFEGADCRVCLIVLGTEDEARRFLGPVIDERLTFVDPDRGLVSALELGSVPAFIHIRPDLTVEGKAEGWDPDEWRAMAHVLEEQMSWHAPVIPEPGDPAPFPGAST